MKPGIYYGMSNEAYHGGEGVSKSMLDTLAARSPLHLHYKREHANDNEKPVSAAFTIGTAFHALLLEPREFTRTYCLSIRPQDVEGGCVESKEELLALVAELNATRLPKLSSSGSKDDLVGVIIEAYRTQAKQSDAIYGRADLEAMKAAELKTEIARLNESRQGLLPTTGTMESLAVSLRDAGRAVTLWQDVKAEWLENNSQRIVLKQENWDMLHNMRDAVMAHPAAYMLLTKKRNIVVDLKTTEDAGQEEFARSCAAYRYHVQQAYYLDGLREAIRQAGIAPEELPAGVAELSVYWNDPKTGVLCRCRPDFWRGSPDNFVFLAVEKGARVVNGKAMGVAVYLLDDAPKDDADQATMEHVTSVELGRALYRRDLDEYAACVASGEWRGYGEKISPLRLPAFEFTRNKHLFAA